MRWSEMIHPARMARVALVAPDDERLRTALVSVADAGTVEFEAVAGADEPSVEPRGRSSTAPARLSATPPDLDELDHAGLADLLAGEAEVRRYAESAIRGEGVAALVGWCPADEVGALRDRLSPEGAGIVPLPAPRGVDPPTLLRASSQLGRSFSPLVRTYGTVPYADIDPTLLAGIAYVVMFGMMFADAGHGLILLAAAFTLRAGWPKRLGRLRERWPFVAGAGLASTAFGVLLGEFFGPTGVVPVRWLDPLDQPVQLLAAGVALGGILLAGAYAVGVVNRWREGSLRFALYAPSGIAGAALFVGLAGLAAGVYSASGLLTLVGLVVAIAGLVLAGIGLFVASGGGAAGATQTAVELFDLVIRLGANLVSFARLAAFGLTHAALAGLVWTATAALWAGGGWSIGAAVLVFAVGNAIAFGLEALVAGVQALRLEYYELFSRVFELEGRPFRPWHIPVMREEATR